MDLKELETSEGPLDQHWYYASKARAIDKILGGIPFSHVADIGAGSAFFAKHLLKHRQDALQATCVDVNYEKEREEWTEGKRISYRKNAHGAAADLYLLMDVLEHVKRDGPFLESIVKAAPREAHFLITVPAFGFLWSGHDIYLGHYRRYSLKEITEVAKHAGLTIEKACYFFGAIFPAVAAVRVGRSLLPGLRWRTRSDMRRFSPFLNRMLLAVCRMEEKVFTKNRAFGLTALVLAKRSECPETGNAHVAFAKSTPADLFAPHQQEGGHR
jgi:hypothetical protein